VKITMAPTFYLIPAIGPMAYGATQIQAWRLKQELWDGVER